MTARFDVAFGRFSPCFPDGPFSVIGIEAAIADRVDSCGALRQNLGRVDAPAKPGTDFPGVIDVLGAGNMRFQASLTPTILEI